MHHDTCTTPHAPAPVQRLKSVESRGDKTVRVPKTSEKRKHHRAGRRQVVGNMGDFKNDEEREQEE